MKYTIYKITNQINNKIYIGKHQTIDPHDDYIGSGLQLWRSIRKHGKENFKKEILHIFDNEDDMNAKEAELVTEEFCSLDSNYNLCPGGKGGWGYVNNINPHLRIKGHGLETNKKISNSMKGQKRPNLREYNLKKHAAGEVKYDTFTGKTHTKETKRRIGEKTSIHQIGEGNSQFGTMWITNGSSNKKINKLETIPDGWYKGRKMK